MTIEQVILLALIFIAFLILASRIIYLIGYRKGYSKKVEAMYKLRFKFRADLDRLQRDLIIKNSDQSSDQFSKLDSAIIKILNLKKQLDSMDTPDK